MAEFSMQQLQALNAAIVGVRLEVSYDGRTVKYRSMDDLIRARDIVRESLKADGSLTEVANSNRGPSSLAYFSRD